MLLARIVTAVIAIIAILVVLFVLPPTMGKVVIALVIAAAAWEWSAFLQAKSLAARLAYVALIIGACALTLPEVAVLRAEALLLIAGFRIASEREQRKKRRNERRESSRERHGFTDPNWITQH